jgi:nitroreductase
MQTESPTDRADGQVTEALAEAVAAAGYAPSIQNTQPWRWRLAGDTLDLYIERSRILEVTDPDTRLATLSCGAALHHARTALAAHGWHATVTRMPNAADNDHLAHVRVDGSAPANAQAVRQVRTIPLRHTDRRPVGRSVVGREDLRDIVASVEGEGAWLRVLNADQVLDLAAAASQAQQTERANPAWHAELSYWTDGARSAGAGMPKAGIPHGAAQTTVADGKFGHTGELAISATHDRAAAFAILYGGSDEPRDWIRAGEGLSAGWLTATERGVSVLPLSAPVEVIGTRDALRRLLAYLHHPFLVVRFGSVDPAAADPPQAPRLAVDQIIERR